MTIPIRRPISTLLTLTLAAATLPGCTRAVSEGYYGLTGASGKATLLTGDPDRLGRVTREYGAVRVEPFANEVGDICPPTFLEALPGAIENELRYRDRSLTDRVKGRQKEELGPFLTGPTDRVLLIKGRIIQYDVGSTVDKVAGPMDEAICRVQFLDAASGTLIADANLTGRVKSALRTGPQELAAGVAKSVKGLLKPKDKPQK